MTSRRLIHCAVFIPLVLHAMAGHACRVSPAGQSIGVDEQIRQATQVAVGQVISATQVDRYEVEYRFITLEQLAGQSGKVFTVMGRAGHRGGQESTFNNHTDFSFWAHGGGRLMNDTDCVIHPDFAIGSSYLVFLGTPLTRRSLEKIDMVNGTISPDDRWLTYVRQQVARREASGANAATLPQASEGKYERIGKFIYGFHRIIARTDLDRKTLAARHAPPELLLRVGSLADEFDHILADNTVPDAEVEATLHEAVAVKKILAAWADSGNGTMSQAR